MDEPERYAKTWRELNQKHPELKWIAMLAILIAAGVVATCIWPNWMSAWLPRLCCQ